ncbi:Uso1/p115-like vesicle tethering protein C-terminal [Trinorchestia longiramus]|nr:Uso1/p115-like vesicle tethering protein C-terminal [Trinorchestia longiramus]
MEVWDIWVYQQQLQLLQQQNGSSGDSSGGAAIAALQQQVSELTYARDYYYYQMQERDKLVQQLQQQKQEEADAAATKSAVEDRNTDGVGSDPADPELETLRCQLRDLQLVLHKKDEALYQLQQGNMTNGSAEEESKQLLDLKKKLESSEAAVQQLQATNVSLQKQLQAADARRTEGDSEEELEAERRKRKKLEEELGALQGEQEDLLLLLTEQDGRLQRYKSHLTMRGVTPPPGEEQGEEEEEGDSDQDVTTHSLAYAKFPCYTSQERCSGQGLCVPSGCKDESSLDRTVPCGDTMVFCPRAAACITHCNSGAWDYPSNAQQPGLCGPGQGFCPSSGRCVSAMGCPEEDKGKTLCPAGTHFCPAQGGCVLGQCEHSGHGQELRGARARSSKCPPGTAFCLSRSQCTEPGQCDADSAATSRPQPLAKSCGPGQPTPVGLDRWNFCVVVTGLCLVANSCRPGQVFCLQKGSCVGTGGCDEEESSGDLQRTNPTSCVPGQVFCASSGSCVPEDQCGPVGGADRKVCGAEQEFCVSMQRCVEAGNCSSNRSATTSNTTNNTTSNSSNTSTRSNVMIKCPAFQMLRWCLCVSNLNLRRPKFGVHTTGVLCTSGRLRYTVPLSSSSGSCGQTFVRIARSSTSL